MIKLNLGSGSQLAKGYINVDKMFTPESLKVNRDKNGVLFEESIQYKNVKFVQADILDLPFKNNFADLVEAHQVLEHLKIRDLIPALKEIRRVMKKGARFMFSTPNFDGLCLEWLGMEMRSMNTIGVQTWLDRAEEFYGIQVNEGEEHRCPITPNWIVFCLNQAGFIGPPKRMAIFGKQSRMPNKGFGLLSLAKKKYGSKTVFRHETIFGEAVK